MIQSKKKGSICLQHFLFLLIINSLYDRYFVIIVHSFEFIVVFIRSFPAVFEKLFSHSNPFSFLVNNLFYQPVRVFCTHLLALTKDWSTQLAISKPNSMFCIELGFVSIGKKSLLGDLSKGGGHFHQ